MPRARVSRLTVAGSISDNKRARIRQLELVGTTGATATYRARISQVTLTGTVNNRRARISRLQLVGSSAVSLLPVLTASVTRAEPGSTVTVTTAGTTGNQVNVVFSTPSPDVTLVGTGQSRTFVAPRDWRGRQVVVQATFTDGFGTTLVRTVSIAVLPQQFWFLRSDSVLVPVTNPFRRI